MSNVLAYADTLKEALQKASSIDAIMHERRNRMLSLMDKIRESNGRLALRSDVDAYLVHLQRRAHHRSVGLYEQLLTALVQDILPENTYPISLVLDTDKGLPSLSIELGKKDEAQDIFDDTGGSLTNVVSAGLRFVALARSGLRKFMILDEPDCWIEPDRIPSFANVLADMSAKIKVQTILISHYKGNAFSNIGNRLRLEKKDGAILVHRDKSEPWADDKTPGIRWIRLENFMSHQDSMIELGPGINSLSGPNHIGKSAVVRAFRVFAYHEGADRNIMHGKDFFKISIGLENGKILTCTRYRKAARKTVYTYIDSTMTEPRVEPAGKTSVPDFVIQALNIQKLNDLDIQLSHQKMPVFLLNEPKTKQATILSAGMESDYVRNMLREYKTWLDNDQALIRTSEKEIQGIKPSIDAWEKTYPEGLLLEGKALEARLNLLMLQLKKSQDLNSIIQSITKAETLSKYLEEVEYPVQPQLTHKPEMNRLALHWEAQLKAGRYESLEVKVQEPVLDKLLQMAEHLRKWKKSTLRAQQFEGVGPQQSEPVAPTLSNHEMLQVLKSWEHSHGVAMQTEQAVSQSAAALQQLEEECDALIAENGDACPLCAQSWPHSHSKENV